jgi:hypothetical protein
MKDITRLFITISIAVFFVTAIFISDSPAPVRDRPTEDPPFGLKIEGAAKGKNHIGVISGEYYNFNKAYELVDDVCDSGSVIQTADVRALVRLRQGNQTSLQTLYGEKTEAAIDVDLADMQDEIIDLMECQVLNAFFNAGLPTNDDGTCVSPPPLQVVLKDADQFGELNTDTALTGVQGQCEEVIETPTPPDCMKEVKCGGSSFFLWDVVVVAN